MTKIKRYSKSNAIFKQVEAISTFKRIYPIKFEALRQGGRLDIALAIGYAIISKLVCKQS